MQLELEPPDWHRQLWHMNSFQWRGGKWKYEGSDPTKKFQEKVELTQVPVSQARRTLGVYLAPDGNNEDILRGFKDKARLWSDQMRAGHLGRDASWRALVTTIFFSVIREDRKMRTLSHEIKRDAIKIVR